MTRVIFSRAADADVDTITLDLAERAGRNVALAYLKRFERPDHRCRHDG